MKNDKINLKLTIQLDPTTKAQLIIYEDSDPEQLANQFINNYQNKFQSKNLKKMKQKIKQKIEQSMKQYLNEDQLNKTKTKSQSTSIQTAYVHSTSVTPPKKQKSVKKQHSPSKVSPQFATNGNYKVKKIKSEYYNILRCFFKFADVQDQNYITKNGIQSLHKGFFKGPSRLAGIMRNVFDFQKQLEFNQFCQILDKHNLIEQAAEQIKQFLYKKK